MDLISIARRVKSESGRSGSGPSSVGTAVDNDLRVINAVRDCWLELQQEPRNWRWMRKQIAAGALSAGTMQYAPTALDPEATDVARWWREDRDYKPKARRATEDGEWNLIHIPFDRFASMFLAGTHMPGAPQFWSTASNGDLLIGPAPDNAHSYLVRIDYLKKPTELVADGDAPDMPEEHHRLLVWMALRQVAIADGAAEHLVRASDKAEDAYSALLRDQGEQIVFEYAPLAAGR